MEIRGDEQYPLDISLSLYSSVGRIASDIWLFQSAGQPDT